MSGKGHGPSAFVVLAAATAVGVAPALCAFFGFLVTGYDSYEGVVLNVIAAGLFTIHVAGPVLYAFFALSIVVGILASWHCSRH
jgi:hypothetical protein